MALPILDGNQSATTLSTIFTAGAHIPAHTVVSLGSQAISDISSAVSGISISIGGIQSVTGSVSVLNFPATQTVAGTVTANLAQGLIDEAGDVGSLAPRLVVGVYDVDGIQLGANRPFPISGTVTANSIFPRVTLIDGSGTVATANTAITVFASSSTRSYLLVQVTTGSAFVNVGATATTVNGINLTAGQGYSWETTIPQGIVSLISTTTSSRYVAKEA